ncbi:hypothetical protein MF672_024555 [Actinomadura sp. ATCC 31491]|uniref:Uncharacterized protein n=1 Tax=Actinomadura luzonensis TaxID=2805427 RepID=A0ABT0FX66_9ACTN|nr:hypothetical protein [Actinomadura luzonensis]MCK2216938.1 hypothetical protein [Actinomadura luzonensis]
MPCVTSASIEIVPYPVLLGAGPVEVTFLAGFDVPQARGLLLPPSGPPVVLDLAAAPPPCDWRATHAFPPDAATGVWRVVITDGFASVAEEFRVEREGAKPRTRFASFELRPRETVEGERQVVLGKVEVERDGDWAPLAGELVRVAFRGSDECGHHLVARCLSGQDGTFSTLAQALEDGEWRGELDGGDAFVGSRSRAAASRALTGTEIYRYTVSSYPDDRLKHSGILRTRNGHARLDDLAVTVSKGGVSVTDHSTGNPSGRFTVITPRSSGQWRADFFASGGYGSSHATRNYP